MHFAAGTQQLQMSDGDRRQPHNKCNCCGTECNSLLNSVAVCRCRWVSSRFFFCFLHFLQLLETSALGRGVALWFLARILGMLLARLMMMNCDEITIFILKMLYGW